MKLKILIYQEIQKMGFFVFKIFFKIKKFLSNALSKKLLLIRYRWIIQKLLRKKNVENEKNTL
jgi:hypothetical protein